MNDTTDAITTYLDDLGRMLAHLDPAERADVLGGVREHVDASLAELGHAPSDQEVAAVLASLGAPEDVARVASGSPRVLPPDGGAAPRPSLTAAWVAPVVFALAIVLIGLFTMIARQKAVTQLVGFLVLENGLFLGATAATHGMPLIVELGVFFDVLIATLIAGIYTNRLQDAFDSIDTSHLTVLKE